MRNEEGIVSATLNLKLLDRIREQKGFDEFHGLDIVLRELEQLVRNKKEDRCLKNGEG